jgi:hypothetical protein
VASLVSRPYLKHLASIAVALAVVLVVVAAVDTAVGSAPGLVLPWHCP